MHISTNEFVSPFLIISLENLPPDIIPNESIIRVFPAPVSPVNTFNPLFKSILKSSIIPIFLMCNVDIIKRPPKKLYIVQSYILFSNNTYFSVFYRTNYLRFFVWFYYIF